MRSFSSDVRGFVCGYPTITCNASSSSMDNLVLISPKPVFTAELVSHSTRPL